MSTTIQSLLQMQPQPEIEHLGVGIFDGVHRGHQAVLAAVLANQASSGSTAVLTFDPHPLRLIRPEKMPPRLTTLSQRMELVKKTGINHFIVISFDDKIRHLNAATFVKELHRIFPRLKTISVGQDWSFGKDREGTAERLADLVKTWQWRVQKVPPVQWQGQAISSTRIREAIIQRRFSDAEAMLGRPYAVIAQVKTGEGIGRTLGFPTANLAEIGSLLPPHGVYACEVLFLGKKFYGIMNYGVRPTFNKVELAEQCEVHVLDFQGDLYGQAISVGRFHFIREEKKFKDGEALKRQIVLDIAQVRQWIPCVSDS